MGKEGQYVLSLWRENSDGETYIEQQYAITRKDAQFIESYLRKKRFRITSVVGAKKPIRISLDEARCKLGEPPIDGNASTFFNI